MAKKKTEKCGKWKMHTGEPGIWWETLKSMENRKCSLYDLDYGKKTEKRRKRDTNTLGPGIWGETLKNVEKEKCSL